MITTYSGWCGGERPRRAFQEVALVVTFGRDKFVRVRGVVISAQATAQGECELWIRNSGNPEQGYAVAISYEFNELMAFNGRRHFFEIRCNRAEVYRSAVMDLHKELWKSREAVPIVDLGRIETDVGAAATDKTSDPKPD